jgi:non-lysosomal glucosylceramidase
MHSVSSPAWPVLRGYEGDQLRRIALPLGGIGTGTVSLGGRGDLRSWEIRNRPDKNYRPPVGFFAIRTETESGTTAIRVAEGQLDVEDYEGAFGSAVPVAGLPRFRRCRFETAYPFGQVILSDPDVPVQLRLQAFNPLIPAAVADSALPATLLRYVLTNPTQERVRVSICGSLSNITTGGDRSPHVINTERTSDGLTGVLLSCADTQAHTEDFGSLALAVMDPRQPSVRTSWPVLSWGDSLLNFWEDLADDGRVEQQSAVEEQRAVCSVSDSVEVAPGEQAEISFVLAWHFPNRRGWIGERTESIDHGRLSDDIVGNHYATLYEDAWQAAADFSGRLPELETRTLDFIGAFCDSSLPDPVKEAALFNLSTLRTETCFRTADGRFYGWEGIGDTAGSCFGSCTHVWNYEQATAFLFGELARSMRDTEFGYMTDDEGLMSFRVGLPLSKRARAWGIAAADGQMGALVKLYRDWRLSGDDNLLKAAWPAAKRALEFCWLPGGWDADQDGVMEGVQHNTMDVEYYGPNPQMGAWYLAALRSVAEMARYLGEDSFAADCEKLFAQGSAWLDANLFNGEYYRHEIRPVASLEDIHPGLRHPSMGARDLSEPELQLGDGCLVDQLVGQFLAHVAGLGHLLNPDHVLSTLRSIVKYNFKPDFYAHANHMRSFVIGGESALVMASYPHGNRPTRPFPYFAEVMTGFEYTAAVGLAYEGQFDDALRIIQAIRDRYDGAKRNPFDEAECGHHYARAMASWGAVLAWSGFDYDGRSGDLRFRGDASDVRHIWSTGDAWGRWQQNGRNCTLTVSEGSLKLAALTVTGLGRFELGAPRTLSVGERLEITDWPGV